MALPLAYADPLVDPLRPPETWRQPFVPMPQPIIRAGVGLPPRQQQGALPLPGTDPTATPPPIKVDPGNPYLTQRIQDNPNAYGLLAGGLETIQAASQPGANALGSIAEGVTGGINAMLSMESQQAAKAEETRRWEAEQAVRVTTAKGKSLAQIAAEAAAKRPPTQTLAQIAAEAAAKRPPTQTLAQIAAEAAAKRQTPEQAAAVARAQAEARLSAGKGRITKAADGFHYYDNGERAFPDVEKPEDEGLRRRYQNAGLYVNQETGEIIGEGVFDTTDGERFIVIDGERVPVPDNAVPKTKSDANKNAMTGEQFFSLATEAADAEKSIRELTRFMDGVANTSQGWRLLADQVLGGLNTVFGEQLTEEQREAIVAEGRLQGLLGANRVAVLGGGVMTEQDALRLISRLGGDFNMTRNKEAAALLIKDLFDEKVWHYNNLLLPTYNGQLKATYRGEFTAKEPIEFDASMFDLIPEAEVPIPKGYELVGEGKG